MADVAGFNATLSVSTDGGTNYTLVGGSKDFKGPTEKSARIDKTDNDGGRYSEGVAGRISATLSVTCNKDLDDVGQQALRTACRSGVVYDYRYRDETGTGKEEVLFKATVNGVDASSKTQGDADSTYELEFTGTPTYQAQT